MAENYTLLYPLPTNLTNPVDLFTYHHNTLNIPFTELALIVTFIVAIVGFKSRGFPLGGSLAASSFITTIFASIFYYMNAINGYWPLGAIVATGASVVIMFNESD